ncbi:MAG: chalcone isomerase family protein [Deltaproteobacteria bacterium]|nr:chalcone isomerase family protein [Deltaproteobacteria bacterium]
MTKKRENMAWMRSVVAFVFVAFFPLTAVPVLAEEDVEILGVRFPTEKVVEGKILKLNGVAYRKALGIVKVYVVGLYLEKTTGDPQEVITSEQIKQLHFHYLTDRATAKKLREGYLELMKECNPAEMYERNEEDILLYASWLDKDMQPGLTSVSTYVPGKGLALEYQGEERGTITNKEFIEMYYRYNFGEKADKKIRNGLLGNEMR